MIGISTYTQTVSFRTRLYIMDLTIFSYGSFTVSDKSVLDSICGLIGALDFERAF